MTRLLGSGQTPESMFISEDHTMPGPFKSWRPVLPCRLWLHSSHDYSIGLCQGSRPDHIQSLDWYAWLLIPLKSHRVRTINWGQVESWGSCCIQGYTNLSGMHCHKAPWWYLGHTCMNHVGVIARVCVDDVCDSWYHWRPGVWVTTWGHIGVQGP